MSLQLLNLRSTGAAARALGRKPQLHLYWLRGATRHAANSTAQQTDKKNPSKTRAASSTVQPFDANKPLNARRVASTSVHVSDAPSFWEQFASIPQEEMLSLTTKDGYILLPVDGDLSRYGTSLVDPEVCKQLHGLATPLLCDSRVLTAAEIEVVRQDIRDHFHATFTLFERMHETFRSSPAYFIKHEKLRHPPVFYLGHTASFYVNKLHLGKYISERIDPVLEMQMAVGVDEMSWDDWDSNSYVWPSGEEAEADIVAATVFLQKVWNFRRDVRQLVDKLLVEHPIEWPIKSDSFWWVILMGIEHERIHLETSSVIFRQAELKYVQPTSALPVRCPHGLFSTTPISDDLAPQNTLIPVEEGSTRIGRSWEGSSTYGWDNEFGNEQHRFVPAFAASEFLVTNHEFLSFVKAGGYTNKKFWSEEGWNWVTDMKPEAPLFWEARGDEFYLRSLAEEIPMPWDWPVEVSNHEAAAFCKYMSEKTGKSLRLPSEDEFMRLRDAVPTDLQNSKHGPAWGARTPGNVNLAHWSSSCPVDYFKSPSGVYDVLGNVWQHSASDLDVLDGFRTHPLYDDFTTPTVDGLHSRIMGGSWISTGCNGATRDARFGFRRHFYQHAGFRYVESDHEVRSGVTPYERDRDLCNSFRFHFMEPAFGENYPAKLAQTCVDALIRTGKDLKQVRALELGCGPGRTVLELGEQGLFSVHGAERTAKEFQCTEQQLLRNGRLRWTDYIEGDIIEHREVSLAQLKLNGHDTSSLRWIQTPDFAVADKKTSQTYDLVVCAQPGALSNNPSSLLASVHNLLNPGGLLVLGSQYDWAPVNRHTSSRTGGDAVLADILKPWFEATLDSVDLPFTKAETARKFSCGVQHVTFWKRLGEKRASENPQAPDAQPLDEVTVQGQAMYDDDQVLGQYLDFHYGPNSDYPVAFASRCLEAMRELGVPLRRALEVGGGPGRAGLELSKHFEHVDSGDYSQSFVDLAQRLLTEGKLEWNVMSDRTAGIAKRRSVSVADLGSGSITFSQMDAQALPTGTSKYDLICGFNLIDRLARPKDFLLGAKARLNPGGLLVLSSPYTWLEDFTPKSEWLGAFKYGDNDAPSTYMGMKELLLAEGFEEVRAPEDVWFRIDELDNGRKSQQTRAEMTFWRLR